MRDASSKRSSFIQHRLLAMLGTASMIGLSSTVLADGHANALQARSWAAACANCHSANAAAGIPSLKGLSQKLIEAKMQAFKNSTDTSVMSQLAKGYTDEQITAIARYYANHSAR